MKKYLAAFVALIVGLSMSVQAVVIEPEGDKPGIDTSEFSSIEEYSDLMKDMFKGADKPYFKDSSAVEEVLGEMEDLDVQETASWYNYILGKHGAPTVYGTESLYTQYITFAQDNDINSIDNYRLMIGYIILNQIGDSELTFVDDMWSDFESDWQDEKGEDFTQTSTYHYARGFWYNRPLGNTTDWQNNMEQLLKDDDPLSGCVTIGRLSHVIDPKFDFEVTKDMILDFCKTIRADQMNEKAVTNLMKAFSRLSWDTSNIQAEIDFCNEILISVQPTDLTSPFLSDVKSKRNMLKDLQ